MRRRIREPVPELPASGASREWLTVDGTPHRRVVLCLIIRDSPGSREVLLGLKRTGFGAGRVVAIGGKVDGDESDLGAVVREVREETGLRLRASEVRAGGRITWTFPAHPAWSMTASLYTARGEGSAPVACEEIEPRWYDVLSIPWESMWKDAPYWLPLLLDGEATARPARGLMDARIVMAGDNENVAEAVVRMQEP